VQPVDLPLQAPPLWPCPPDKAEHIVPLIADLLHRVDQVVEALSLDQISQRENNLHIPRQAKPLPRNSRIDGVKAGENPLGIE
jgi:hypothetical protein